MSAAMAPVPAAIRAASAPQVNLIPPEVASRRARGRARALIASVLIVVLVVLGALVFLQQRRVDGAEAALAEVNGETERLQNVIASYAEVPQVEAELRNVTEARLYVGGTEVHWSELYNDLRLVTPPSVSYTSIAWNLPDIFGAEAPNQDPLGSPDIGSISFTGESENYIDVAELTRALDSLEWLEDTWITSTVIQGEGDAVYYAYSGTSRVEITALSNRYSEQWLADRAAEEAARAAEEAEAEAETVEEPVDSSSDASEEEEVASDEG